MDREAFLGKLVDQLVGFSETGETDLNTQILAAAEGLGQWVYSELQRNDYPPKEKNMRSYGQLLAGLKNTIGGRCSVLDGNEVQVTVKIERCPFQSVIRQSPHLCMITAGVFGSLTRCRFGYSRVVLERTIAEGHPSCLITIAAQDSPVTMVGTSLEFVQPPRKEHGRFSNLQIVAGHISRRRPKNRRILSDWRWIKNQLETNLLQGLINGAFTEEENIPLRQLTDLGWRPAPKYRMLVITLGRSSSTTGPNSRAEIFRQRLRRCLPGCLVGYQSRTEFLVLTPEIDPEALDQQVRIPLAGITLEPVSVAAGGSFSSLGEAHSSYLQASAAMHVLNRLGREGETLFFDQLGVYRLFQYLKELPQAREIAKQTLGPLLDYDRKKRSSLVRTLEEYFSHDCSVHNTASALFIHPTTLKYRLHRAQEIGGFDLSRVEDRLSLLLNLRLMGSKPFLN